MVRGGTPAFLRGSRASGRFTDCNSTKTLSEKRIPDGFSVRLTQIKSFFLEQRYLTVPSRMIMFPLGDQPCSWQDRF
jgi:hypothetical protein